MKKHFIREIKIQRYKSLQNFQADGFARINLIGGKNNVGKTAFMEALYLISNLQDFYQKENEDLEREKLYFEIIKSFISLQINRYGVDFLLSWIADTVSLNSFSNFEIEIPKKYKLLVEDNIVSPNRFQKYNYWNDGFFEIYKYEKNKYFYRLKEKKNAMPEVGFYKFVTMCSNNQTNIRKLLSKIKKDDKNDELNGYLFKLFNISKIDMTDEDVLLFDIEKKSYRLSEYGDGVKNFINIILTILYDKERVVFLDEIENGVHYTKFDAMWKIIFQLSKENGVQIFATTHSKELIESYARVSKELQDESVSYIKMTQLDDGNIMAGVRDYEMLQSSIENSHEVRGW
jgi:AAA15 family ATPase/GTPase